MKVSKRSSWTLSTYLADPCRQFWPAPSLFKRQHLSPKPPIRVIPKSQTVLETVYKYNFQTYYLISEQYDKSVPLIIDNIRSAVKIPVSELPLALICALCWIGRFSEALTILESCVLAEPNKPNSTISLQPPFIFQKAKIFQSLSLDSIHYFNIAMLGFRTQLGAHNIITQSCRYGLLCSMPTLAHYDGTDYSGGS